MDESLAHVSLVSSGSHGGVRDRQFPNCVSAQSIDGQGEALTSHRGVIAQHVDQSRITDPHGCGIALGQHHIVVEFRKLSDQHISGGGLGSIGDRVVNRLRIGRQVIDYGQDANPPPGDHLSVELVGRGGAHRLDGEELAGRIVVIAQDVDEDRHPATHRGLIGHGDRMISAAGEGVDPDDPLRHRRRAEGHRVLQEVGPFPGCDHLDLPGLGVGSHGEIGLLGHRAVQGQGRIQAARIRPGNVIGQRIHRDRLTNLATGSVRLGDRRHRGGGLAGQHSHLG